MQETHHPEMPMTMAGEGVPSLMMHQFLRSALRRASSSRSCCNIGRPLSLSKLQVARLSRHPESRYIILRLKILINRAASHPSRHYTALGQHQGSHDSFVFRLGPLLMRTPLQAAESLQMRHLCVSSVLKRSRGACREEAEAR